MMLNGAQNVTIIPNGWSRKNALWLYRKKNVHQTIGWCGTATHRMDFNECKKAIEDLSRGMDFDIVIGGDYEIYDRINMPPHRKIFLPFTSYDNYPWMLGWMDIMLVPLRTDQFNLGKSDIKLVDAAAKGIPYVASDVPQYRDHKGGIVVDTKDSWMSAIADLLKDHDLVDRHVSEVFEFAQERENDNIALLWMKMFGEIL
jgi:glycosyltransferase involved in cell wall biosynthesis